MNERLAIGTVQFGLPYGIANQTGQVTPDEAAAILEYAWNNGVNTLDTAIDYGNSEQCLGDIGVKQWRISSKLPATPDDCDDISGWVEKTVYGSLDRLGINQLHALLLHHPGQLSDARGELVYKALNNLKDQGLIKKTGISIYGPDELDRLWPNYTFDLVQSPFNLIDRRLATSGWLQLLNKKGVEIHSRSVFLQGLLLMHVSERPDRFRHWQPLWQQWQQWQQQQSVSAVQACLAFAMSEPDIDRVIVGVDSLSQIKEIINSISSASPIPPASFANNDLELINPSLWTLN